MTLIYFQLRHRDWVEYVHARSAKKKTSHFDEHAFYDGGRVTRQKHQVDWGGESHNLSNHVNVIAASIATTIAPSRDRAAKQSGEIRAQGARNCRAAEGSDQPDDGGRRR